MRRRKNGQDTLNQIRRLKPDIVLMDIRMPRLSGLEVVRIAKEEGFAGIFIIISGFFRFHFCPGSHELWRYQLSHKTN
ncbi:response regulator [Lacrimispora xylanisolvens]|uniref:response regulator n=1 Tax=Lacrimispora xylanisolvens TaxID=384636 RepID=UPI003D9C9969